MFPMNVNVKFIDRDLGKYHILCHDDVIKWKHFPRYWPFVREIHRSPVNFPHKGQWRWALMFTLICARMKGWVNNREAGDLRRYRVHYDVIVMVWLSHNVTFWQPRYSYVIGSHVSKMLMLVSVGSPAIPRYTTLLLHYSLSWSQAAVWLWHIGDMLLPRYFMLWRT